MAPNTSEIERAVARTLRDSLEKLQHTSEEVSQAVGDLVSACASARPSNALPHLVRAQSSAMSLAASLEVLARFITGALQPGWSAAASEQEERAVADERIAGTRRAEPAAARPGESTIIEGGHESLPAAVCGQTEQAPARQAGLEGHEISPEAGEGAAEAETKAPGAHHAEMPACGGEQWFAAEAAEPAAEEIAEALRTVAADSGGKERESEAGAIAEAINFEPAVAAPEAVGAKTAGPAAAIQPASGANHPIFSVAALPPEQQELHRRANRVAKVTMQDIKMLRPRDVELGKQNHDLCARLRDDIERAHKEYERRFQAILDHPVDYFHAWMLEILADGDASALGEYPYRSPVLHP